MPFFYKSSSDVAIKTSMEYIKLNRLSLGRDVKRVALSNKVNVLDVHYLILYYVTSTSRCFHSNYMCVLYSVILLPNVNMLEILRCGLPVCFSDK